MELQVGVEDPVQVSLDQGLTLEVVLVHHPFSSNIHHPHHLQELPQLQTTPQIIQTPPVTPAAAVTMQMATILLPARNHSKIIRHLMEQNQKRKKIVKQFIVSAVQRYGIQHIHT